MKDEGVSRLVQQSTKITAGNTWRAEMTWHVQDIYKKYYVGIPVCITRMYVHNIYKFVSIYLKKKKTVSESLCTETDPRGGK